MAGIVKFARIPHAWYQRALAAGRAGRDEEDGELVRVAVRRVEY